MNQVTADARSMCCQEPVGFLLCTGPGRSRTGRRGGRGPAAAGRREPRPWTGPVNPLREQSAMTGLPDARRGLRLRLPVRSGAGVAGRGKCATVRPAASACISQRPDLPTHSGPASLHPSVQTTTTSCRLQERVLNDELAALGLRLGVRLVERLGLLGPGPGIGAHDSDVHGARSRGPAAPQRPAQPSEGPDGGRPTRHPSRTRRGARSWVPGGPTPSAPRCPGRLLGGVRTCSSAGAGR